MTAEGPRPTPTDQWLARTADYLPPLTGPEGVAERLLLLVHYGIDWKHGWVTSYRRTYWDRLLPDRVVTSAFRAPTLFRWWQDLAGELSSAPRNQAERLEVAYLLQAEPQPVLETLRFEVTALLLRTRLVAEAARPERAER